MGKKKKRKKSARFTKVEKAAICTLIEEAQQDLWAGNYHMHFDEPSKDTKVSSGARIAASIEVSPDYYHAIIHFPPEARRMFRTNGDMFVETVYHEIAHCIIDPLYLDQVNQLSPVEKAYFNEKREQAVVAVSRIGLKVRGLRSGNPS